ncbi:MAG: hypoxanthine phosphoribosyltransferase [Elusimicrobiota bacterium]
MPSIIKSRKSSRRHDALESVMYSESQIALRVKALARQIERDHKEGVVIIGVLKGSFMFIADLLRELKVSVQLDFMSLSSYVGDKSSEIVRLNFDIRSDIKGKRVLLIDDIVDTGFSLAFARKHLLSKEPAHLDVGVLLDKPARRKVFVPVRYVGFTIPDAFVVGYGLDYNERYRELPFIGVMDGTKIGP